MSSFITVSSQQGTSKTIVNVNSLNRVSYHSSDLARKVVKNYRSYRVLEGLFCKEDFYSVLDVNGSKINTLDSIEEIEDKLNGVVGSGHGVVYIPHSVLKSNEEVLSKPELVASYLSTFTDILYEDKVFRGFSRNVSIAWTEEMVGALISIYKGYTKDLPNDFTYDMGCFLASYVGGKLEFIKGKPHIGIPLSSAQFLKIDPNISMFSCSLSTFDLRYVSATRCVSPSDVHDEDKGGVVGVSDYTSVSVRFSSGYQLLLGIENLTLHFTLILKKALGVERAKEFLEDLFNMLCFANHNELFSYLNNFPAPKVSEGEFGDFVDLDSFMSKGDHAYVPLNEGIFGGKQW